MVLGMSLSTFTLLHVIISLAGIGSGFIVVYGLLNGKRLDGWTAIFLTTTVLTSVTGFLFPFEEAAALAHRGLHFAGGAGHRDLGALRRTSRRRLALDLRSDRCHRPLFQLLRRGRAGLLENTRPACPGSYRERAAVPGRPVCRPGDLCLADLAGDKTLSRVPGTSTYHVIGLIPPQRDPYARQSCALELPRPDSERLKSHQHR